MRVSKMFGVLLLSTSISLASVTHKEDTQKSSIYNGSIVVDNAAGDQSSAMLNKVGGYIEWNGICKFNNLEISVRNGGVGKKLQISVNGSPKDTVECISLNYSEILSDMNISTNNNTIRIKRLGSWMPYIDYIEYSNDSIPPIPEDTNSTIIPVNYNQSFNWNGNDPFHQPSQTTLFWGSGDVNSDGVIDSIDINRAMDMRNGTRKMNIYADIDMDKIITNADVTAIYDKVNNNIPLQSWWNNLTTTQQKNDYVTKILSLDKTNQRYYSDYYFVCLDYALQLFVNASYYRGDMYYTDYIGGQTQFNIPMYHVSISAPSFGHSINAILIGNNPLNPNDWRFIESQTDYTVVPGMWDMPYGSLLTINVPYQIFKNGMGGMDTTPEIKFEVLSNGIIQYISHHNVITTRPNPITYNVDNGIDKWNSMIIAGTPRIVYEKTVQDSLHNTNIFMGNINNTSEFNLDSSILSGRILDVKRSSDNKYHILWKDASYLTYTGPGIYYGQIDTIKNRIINKTLVGYVSITCFSGKILWINSSTIHLFWHQENMYGIPEIMWSKGNGSTFSYPMNTASTFGLYMDDNWIYGETHWRKYIFDVAKVPKTTNSIVLFYIDQNYNSYTWPLYQKIYNGTSWGAESVIDANKNIRGISSANVADTLCISYWDGKDVFGADWDKGNVYFRKYVTSWGTESIIDSTNKAACVKISSNNGYLYASWIRKTTSIVNNVLPVVGIWNGQWLKKEVVSVTDSSECWYPSVSGYNDSLNVIWSSRKSRGSEIKSHKTSR